MTELSPERVIKIDEILSGYNYKTSDKATMMFIYPEEEPEKFCLSKTKRV